MKCCLNVLRPTFGDPENPASATGVQPLVGDHLSVAFDDDLEAEIRKLNPSQRAGTTTAITRAEQPRSDNQQQQAQYEQAKEKGRCATLNRLLPRLSLLADETLADRVDEIQERLDEAQEAARFVQRHGNQLAKLEPMVSLLQSDPEQFEQLKEDYARSQQVQRESASAGVALTEVVQRRAPAGYSDSAEMLSGNSDLNEKLRERLAQAQPSVAARDEAMRTHAAQVSRVQPVLASLKKLLRHQEELLNDLYKS